MIQTPPVAPLISHGNHLSFLAINADEGPKMRVQEDAGIARREGLEEMGRRAVGRPPLRPRKQPGILISASTSFHICTGRERPLWRCAT